MTQRTEDSGKDRYFAEIAALSQRMAADYGEDFAMGALLLGARWIAEKSPRTAPPSASAGAEPGDAP